MRGNDVKEIFEGKGAKLFLLDVRNGVERNWLLAWLKERHDLNISQKDFIALTISDDQSQRPSVELGERLKTDAETTVIPLRVAWQIPEFSKDSRLKLRHFVFGDPRRPGGIRARLILWRDKKRAQCLIGKPTTIGEMKGRFEAQSTHADAAFAKFVTRQASIVLENAEKDLHGARYKAPRFVAESLRADPDFRAELAKLASDLGKSPAGIEKEAQSYMKEMISRPSPFFIDLRGWFDRYALSLGYEDKIAFDPAEVPRLREMMSEHPTILLFTHKTYIDGGTPTDICYQNDLPMLHIFGGINMNLFGFGYMIKRAGAIFIRRSFQDNLVYKLVLRHYVAYLMKKRFPLTWAFEGTRSRLGKLMPPRYGLLKYVLDAAHSSGLENIHIVPVVTSFDLIKDVEEYAVEQAGRIKPAETIGWFVGYIRSLRKPMGRIHVDLGRAVVVQEAPKPDDKIALPKIAFEFAVEANRVVPLTPTSLMCFCLLGTAPRGLTVKELRAGIKQIVGWAEIRGIRMSDDLTAPGSDAMKKVASTLVDNGLFLRFDQGRETVYAIKPSQHPIASYYRNSIVHHFGDKAIIELALLKAREASSADASKVFWDATERLRDLFKFEFFYPSKDEFRAGLEDELSRIDPEWHRCLVNGGAELKGLVARSQPFVNHAVFLPFVEAYSIVMDVLVYSEAGQILDEKQCVEKSLAQARQALLLGQITSEASIGKILFQNGYKLAANYKLTGEANPSAQRQREELLKELRDLSRRMEISRIEVQSYADNRLNERNPVDATA